jgi:membrane protein implicated in regulation of membrane protease activity
MSDWERFTLGPRGRSLGSSRWPIAGVIAMIAAAVSAWGGMWLEAALFLAAAIVLALVTVRTRDRSRLYGEGRPRT